MLELQTILDEKNNTEITELLQQKQELEISKEKLIEALEITKIEHKQELTDLNKKHETEIKQIREDMEILVLANTEAETELRDVKDRIEKYKEEMQKTRNELAKLQAASGAPASPVKDPLDEDLDNKPKRTYFTEQEEQEIASQEHQVLEEMGFTKDQLKSLGMKHSRHKVRTVILSKQAKLGFLSGVNLQEEKHQEDIKARLTKLSEEVS